MVKLIWSTATYLFCRRCSNGGQGSIHVAAGQSTDDRCRVDRLLFDDRGSNLAVKPGKKGKFAGQGSCVEPPGGIEPPTFSLPSIHAFTLQQTGMTQARSGAVRWSQSRVF